jgi:hypothetical protein
MTDMERETAIDVRLSALSEKLDAIHLSLSREVSKVQGTLIVQDQRISKSELRLAQLQGAGASLTLGLPFIAVVLNKLLGGG